MQTGRSVRRTTTSARLHANAFFLCWLPLALPHSYLKAHSFLDQPLIGQLVSSLEPALTAPPILLQRAAHPNYNPVSEPGDT